MTDAESLFPFMDLLGFELEPRPDGHAAVAIDLAPHHMNPNGIAHGGVMYSLMDTAMGAATMAVVDPGQRCATIEIHVRYLRGGRAGRLTAAATVVHKGRKVVHLEATTVDESGEMLASATGTFQITGEANG